MKLELRRVPFATPGARDARRQFAARQRLLVRLSDSQGRFGLGEATPLPGYGPDTLADAQAALQALSVDDVTAALAQGEQPLAALAATARLLPARAPSARMALETAVLDWLGRASGQSAPALLGGSPHRSVRLAHLTGPAAASELPERASVALRSGYRHLKLKLGAEDALDAEVSAVLALRQVVDEGVSLRLDANGAWTAAQVRAAWQQLASAHVELFEEPGQLPQEPLESLPLALDESLQGCSEDDVDRAITQRQPRAIVLKPTALGGLAHCQRLAVRAQRQGVGVVFSHCFEGSLAWRATAALALALPGGLAHGLAPYDGLSGALPVQAGALHAWSQPGLAEPGAFE